MFAEEMITVEGERSRYFGPDATGGPDIDSASIRTDNRKSDFYIKLVNAPDIVATAWRQQPRAEQARVTGSAARIDNYLDPTRADAFPPACRDEAGGDGMAAGWEQGG